MTEIDHRGIAEHLAETASENEQAGRTGTAMFEVALAQVHATLALSTEDVEDERVADLESQIRDLESDLRLLRETVQPALGYLDQSSGGRAVAVRLRALVR